MEKSLTSNDINDIGAALSRPVVMLSGVGEKRAQLLAKMGIRTIRDLLNYYPSNYIDMSNITPLSDVSDGCVYTIKAKLISDVAEKRTGKKGAMTLYRFLVDDGTCEMSVSLYNQKYLAAKLKNGTTWLFRGKISLIGFFREMASPRIEAPNCPPLLPVYPLTEGVSQYMIRSLINSALNKFSGVVDAVINDETAEKYGLCDIKSAYKYIHNPNNEEELSQGRKRLMAEELTAFRAGIMLNRGRNLRKGSESVVCSDDDVNKIISALPYKLTKAQLNVIDECRKDMAKRTAMARLVQGDVGSGKTAVAAVLMCMAAKCGAQSAMMAPTEILATQHYESLSPLLEKNGVKCALLTGSTKASERKKILAGLADGSIDICIGTHALIQKSVEFANLCFAVTDEQHRFGVAQRTALSDKGKNPHVLVMSATPIPRSMALILYGDLDISVIDELPAGRQKISTFLVDSGYYSRMYNYLREEVKKGAQAYVVCPLAEYDEDSDISMPSAEAYSAELREKYFPDVSVGYIHGKMTGAAKDKIMGEFLRNEISVLVATTVIEVGVNVPNATVMIIESADRFGLSQLHQLRGRVGRGSKKSYCFLVSDNASAAERLKDFCATSDGFEISRKDLELRGPGDFFGNRQHGLPDFRMASLTDMPSLTLSGKIAEDIFKDDDWAEKPENANLVRLSRDLFAPLN